MTSGVTLGVEFWREQLARQRDAGLSISEFCRRRQLSIHTFRSWQRRLNEAPPLLRELIVDTTSVVEDRSGAAPIEIAIGEGVIVRVPRDAAPLTVILRAAKEVAR